ncbi:cobalamin biosynthesis protein [Actinorhabdospora filicis]|uniref:Cobalamin biosynthesis protein n=1 Tax=Actinorhabdospora filicis TaxID=1785913 RepID=A0A9W6SHJ8_9ACTN|nr:CbiX/SirB N-terminal domain-containing protein [Actinorhabdospora filicis]GLZ76108.1 cobalamin biosynthesis protein [Actinorhabdospora filicis]
MTPLVLIAHGSRDGRSSAVVREIAAELGAHASFIDFDEPSPVTLLTSLDEAVVVPLLLTDAFHSRVDVPRLVAEARERRPRLRVEVTAPMGGAHLVPALARTLPPHDAVVLAAAGSRDPRSLAHVGDMARRLAAHTGAMGSPAYAAAAEPDVATAIAGLRSRGARRVAVASYFIAPGLLYERVRADAVAAGAWVTPPLGACPELLAAVRWRYERAVAGPVPVAA